MFAVSLLIPFIISVSAAVLAHGMLELWHYAVIYSSGVVVSLITRALFLFFGSLDTEYLGGYVKSVSYYEPWNELVKSYKTRNVPSGTDYDGNPKFVVETYVEEEVVEHGPEWYMRTSFSNREKSISESEYLRIVKRFGVSPKKVDMSRNYHTVDGDMLYCEWDGGRNTIVPYTKKHRYRNMTKSGNTLFGFRRITSDEAARAGLYEYPEVKEGRQEQILGNRGYGEEDVEAVEYLNSTYGSTAEFRMFVLFFNGDMESAESQKAYWRGGNKNEFVVCIGLDGNGDRKWCSVFSWSEKPELETAVRDFIMKPSSPSIKEVCEFVSGNIRMWKRREFSDFDYIGGTLSSVQSAAVIAMSAAASVSAAVLLLVF